MTTSTSNPTTEQQLHCPYQLGTILIHIFSHPMSLKVSATLTVFLTLMVFFVIYPNVDSKLGFSVIELQLSFDLKKAQEIVSNWGNQGLFFYVKWLFMGYLLAIAYWVLLTGLLIKTQANKRNKWYPWILLLPTLAATLDVAENTLHLCFLSDQLTTEIGFQLLCSTSVAKWSTLTVILAYLVSASNSSAQSST